MSSLRFPRACVLCSLLILAACQDNLDPAQNQPHEVTLRLALPASDVAAVHVAVDADIASMRSEDGISVFGAGDDDQGLIFLADRIFEGESVVLARMIVTGACNAQLVSVANEEGLEQSKLDGYRVSCRSE